MREDLPSPEHTQNYSVQKTQAYNFETSVACERRRAKWN